MKKQGTLVVVSGFAGTGKGTVMKELLGRYDSYALSISATTRQPRPTEVDGREYFFKTKEEFEKMIEENEFLEYACYVGNYYGTPKKYVEEQVNKGREKPIGSWFFPACKYVLCPVCFFVLVIGGVMGGIG